MSAERARSTRSPTIWSASMRTPLCKSRYMDEVSEEPVAVNADFAAAINARLGGTPTAATTATISSSTARAKSGPYGACAISPDRAAHQTIDSAKTGEQDPLLPHLPLNRR